VSVYYRQNVFYIAVAPIHSSDWISGSVVSTLAPWLPHWLPHSE